MLGILWDGGKGREEEEEESSEICVHDKGQEGKFMDKIKGKPDMCETMNVEGMLGEVKFRYLCP